MFCIGLVVSLAMNQCSYPCSNDAISSIGRNIFIGIIIVHRMITFIPPYSGFKYESLNLTTVVLGFLVIVFSIQSKIGLKANILADRVYVLWNGPTENMENNEKPKRQPTHTASRADNQPTETFALQDHIMPNPVAVQKPQQQAVQQDAFMVEPMAANAALGGGFGSTW